MITIVLILCVTTLLIILGSFIAGYFMYRRFDSRIQSLSNAVNGEDIMQKLQILSDTIVPENVIPDFKVGVDKIVKQLDELKRQTISRIGGNGDTSLGDVQETLTFVGNSTKQLLDSEFANLVQKIDNLSIRLQENTDTLTRLDPSKELNVIIDKFAEQLKERESSSMDIDDDDDDDNDKRNEETKKINAEISKLMTKFEELHSLNGLNNEKYESLSKSFESFTKRMDEGEFVSKDFEILKKSLENLQNSLQQSINSVLPATTVKDIVDQLIDRLPSLFRNELEDKLKQIRDSKPKTNDDNNTTANKVSSSTAIDERKLQDLLVKSFDEKFKLLKESIDRIPTDKQLDRQQLQEFTNSLLLDENFKALQKSIDKIPTNAKQLQELTSKLDEKFQKLYESIEQIPTNEPLNKHELQKLVDGKLKTLQYSIDQIPTNEPLGKRQLQELIDVKFKTLQDSIVEKIPTKSDNKFETLQNSIYKLQTNESFNKQRLQEFTNKLLDQFKMLHDALPTNKPLNEQQIKSLVDKLLDDRFETLQTAIDKMSKEETISEVMDKLKSLQAYMEKDSKVNSELSNKLFDDLNSYIDDFASTKTNLSNKFDKLVDRMAKLETLMLNNITIKQLKAETDRIIARINESNDKNDSIIKDGYETIRSRIDDAMIQVKSITNNSYDKFKLDMETSLNVRNEEMIRNIRKLLQVNKFKDAVEKLNETMIDNKDSIIKELSSDIVTNVTKLEALLTRLQLTFDTNQKDVNELANNVKSIKDVELSNLVNKIDTFKFDDFMKTQDRNVKSIVDKITDVSKSTDNIDAIRKSMDQYAKTTSGIQTSIENITKLTNNISSIQGQHKSMTLDAQNMLKKLSKNANNNVSSLDSVLDAINKSNMIDILNTLKANQAQLLTKTEDIVKSLIMVNKDISETTKSIDSGKATAESAAKSISDLKRKLDVIASDVTVTSKFQQDLNNSIARCTKSIEPLTEKVDNLNYSDTLDKIREKSDSNEKMLRNMDDTLKKTALAVQTYNGKDTMMSYEQILKRLQNIDENTKSMNMTDSMKDDLETKLENFRKSLLTNQTDESKTNNAIIVEIQKKIDNLLAKLNDGTTNVTQKLENLNTLASSLKQTTGNELALVKNSINKCAAVSEYTNKAMMDVSERVQRVETPVNEINSILKGNNISFKDQLSEMQYKLNVINDSSTKALDEFNGFGMKIKGLSETVEKVHRNLMEYLYTLKDDTKLMTDVKNNVDAVNARSIEIEKMITSMFSEDGIFISEEFTKKIKTAIRNTIMKSNEVWGNRLDEFNNSLKTHIDQEKQLKEIMEPLLEVFRKILQHEVQP